MKERWPLLLVVMVAIVAFGPVLWNGAGFSLPDDLHAAQLRCCGFRPLVALSYQFNALVGGWMATNLTLHILAALLVLGIAKNTAAACIFAAHPLATDAVASVSGRSGQILAIAVLASVWAFRRFHVERRWIVAAGLVLIVMAGGFVPSYWDGLRLGEFVPHVRQMAAMTGGYLVPRLFVPVGLSADPGITYSLGREIIGWLTLPLAAPMLPYFLLPLPDLLFEHRAYLTLAWFSILAVRLLTRMPKVSVVAIMMVFIVLSNERVKVYSSPVAAMEDAMWQAPNKARIRVNLAYAYGQLNRLEDAERELELAVQLDPDLGMAWKNLAAVRLFRGNIQGAMRIFEQKQGKLEP